MVLARTPAAPTVLRVEATVAVVESPNTTDPAAGR